MADERLMSGATGTVPTSSSGTVRASNFARGTTSTPAPGPSTSYVTTDSLAEKTSDAAEATIRELLRTYGLEDLTSWALGLLSQGASPERVEYELEEQPAFRTRFRAIFERREQIKRGRELPSISVDEILTYEKQVSALESFYGYPAGTLGDPQDRLIDDVSYSELESLVAAEQNYLLSDESMQEVFRQFYGIGATQGELVAMAINEEVGLPILQRRIQAAEVASQSVVAGFGDLTAEEAEGLAARGVDEGAAREAFSLLARSQQLTRNFTRSDLLSLAAGEAPAVEQFQRNQRRALSQFAGGGGFAGGTAGIA